MPWTHEITLRSSLTGPMSSEQLDENLLAVDERATAAVNAADVAIASAGIFADTAAGLSATPEGGYFSVVSAVAAEYTLLYRKVSGAAVYQKTLPSASGVVPSGGSGVVNQLSIEKTTFPILYIKETGAATGKRNFRVARSGGVTLFQDVSDDLASATTRVAITDTGNLELRSPGLLGYGSGTGGTVTQTTSKSTAVTLNKPAGQVTMHAEALGAGATVIFAINNSLVSTSDVVISSFKADGVINYANYNLWFAPFAGGITCYLRNISGSSLSHAVVFNFQVHKGALA